MTKHALNDADDIEQSATDFVDQVKTKMQHYTAEEIMNIDQVGLEKELHSTRILSFQSETLTVATIKSTNTVSHCYTVQPIINLTGQIVGPIYLCLEEFNGHIGQSKFN